MVVAAAACGGGDGGPPAAGGASTGTAVSPDTAGTANPGSIANPVGAAPVTVAVSVAPLAWLVEGVGGGRAAATVMIPAGTSPHAYEPSPREMAALDRARVFVAVGHPHLAFERRHVEPALAARPRIEVVRLSAAGGGAAAALAAAADHPHPDEHADQDEHSHSDDDDPHLWLSPVRMRAAAGDLAAALARVDPAGAAGYRERLAAVHRRIDEVDREVAALLDGLPRRRFLVYHPAWGAFAEHYGLEQVAIERHGKEPSARELAARVDEARAEGVGTVFVQRGFAERPARVVAAELGARVVPLDPLARDWDDNLLAVARALRRELGSPAGAAAEAEAAR
jgi:zinc transport system substrate-binding protein